MVATEATFTGALALAALKPLGFEVIRETDRVYIARGAMRFTLPKGDELCNPNLNHVIHQVIDDLHERAIHAGRERRNNRQPLMVSLEGNVYAVVESRNENWQLQDLDDGHRFQALKARCRPYDPEPLRAEPKMVINHIPDPSPKEEVLPAAIPLPPLLLTGNPTDWAALTRLTQRRLEGIKIEYEQLLNKARTLREQYSTTAAFVQSLGQEVPEIGEALEPLGEMRRTVLKPSNAGGGRKSGGKHAPMGTVVTPELIDRMRMAWIDAGKPSGYGYMGKIKAKMKGVDLPPDQALYRAFKEVVKL